LTRLIPMLAVAVAFTLAQARDARAVDCSAIQSEPTPAEEIVAEIARHAQEEAESGVGLNPPNLSGQNLASALSKEEAATLFKGANLSGANLRCANLSGFDFTGSTLVGAVLDGSRLEGALLTGARLTDASIVGASLAAAQLDGSVLVGADLSDADLTGANLSKADLARANLSNARLINTVIDEAVLDNAAVGGAVWQTRGDVTGDTASSLSGLAHLRVGFCKSDWSELSFENCERLAERPDLAALVKLKKILSEAGDGAGRREVRQAIGRTTTELAIARWHAGEQSSFLPMLTRSIWHKAFLDHGGAMWRAVWIGLAQAAIFAVAYVLVHLSRKSWTGEMFWVTPEGRISRNIYRTPRRTDEQTHPIGGFGRPLVVAGIVYSIIASIRVGIERMSLLDGLLKAVPKTTIVEAVGALAWIGLLQSALALSLISVAGYYWFF